MSVGSEVALRKYEARLSGAPGTGDAEGDDEPWGCCCAIDDDEARETRGEEGEGEEMVLEVSLVFLVRGGGGPTRARGRTDLGGMTAEGTSCRSLSNSSGTTVVGGGEEDGGRGGEGEGETGGGGVIVTIWG